MIIKKVLVIVQIKSIHSSAHTSNKKTITLLKFPMPQVLQVYDANFAGFVTEHSEHILTKVNENFSFNLDGIGSNDIPVD